MSKLILRCFGSFSLRSIAVVLLLASASPVMGQGAVKKSESTEIDKNVMVNSP